MLNWIILMKQGKSEGFDSYDRPNNLTQIGFKSSILQPVWPWNLMDDLQKLKGTSSTLHQALCIISNPSVNSNWSYCPETVNSGQNRLFFVTCDLEIWWMALKNNRAPLLCYIKLCASFQSHRWIQTAWSSSPETLNSGQNRRFFVPCDLEIWRMTLKNNMATVLCYFKLCALFRSHWWIETGVTVRKRPFWVKIDDFLAVWPRNLMDDLEKQ